MIDKRKGKQHACVSYYQFCVSGWARNNNGLNATARSPTFVAKARSTITIVITKKSQLMILPKTTCFYVSNTASVRLSYSLRILSATETIGDSLD